MSGMNPKYKRPDDKLKTFQKAAMAVMFRGVHKGKAKKAKDVQQAKQ